MNPHRVARPIRRAFTLVELTLAMSILAVVLLGAHAVVLLALKALPDRKNDLSVRVSTAAAAELLSAMLSDATAFTAADATRAEFTVPDRTGDGVADVVLVEVVRSVPASR